MADDWKQRIIVSIGGKRLRDMEEFDEKIHSIDTFYDRNIRFWTILLLNKERTQIGEAEYEPRRELAIKHIKMLMKEHGISIVTGIKIK